jgi:hypothetical protein
MIKLTDDHKYLCKCPTNGLVLLQGRTYDIFYDLTYYRYSLIRYTPVQNITKLKI